MKKSFNQTIFFSCVFILFACMQAHAGNYTWTGATSTDFATGSNFSPNGVPGANDTLTIVSASNNPVLAGNTSIKKLTMTSGNLDCGGYVLSLSATGTFNAGAINNGTLTCYGTSTLTFAGTTFGVVVNATGNNLLFNGSRFSSTLYACKKGSSSDNGVGNNYFGGATQLVDSGTANLVLSNNSAAPDTFNSTLTVSAAGTGDVFLAHQAVGNLFNGNVTFTTGGIHTNYYGTATFNGNITVSSSSDNISFGNSTGAWSLASGKTVSVGTFSAGTLTIRNLTQSDNTQTMSLVLSGTGKLSLGSNYIHANLKASAQELIFNSCRFFGVDTLIYTGGSTTYCAGGNYFSNTVYIANACTTSNLSFTIGGTYVDTFITTSTIASTGIASMKVNNGLFLGAVTFRNSVTFTNSERFFAEDCRFKGTLTLDCVHSGIEFKPGTGNNILDSTATLALASGFAGHVTLSGFEQRGANAINLNMSTNTSSGQNTILTLGPNATFNSSFTYLGQRLELNGATFNSNASFTRFSQQLDICAGGNTFNGVATYICDSVSASSSNRVFKLANSNPDDFNGSVIFRQYASGGSASTMKMYPAYTATSTFAGNVTVDANVSSVDFGANGGKVIFDGSGTQTISKTGTYAATYKRIQLNKSAGIVSLTSPLTLTDTLFLSKGVICTDTTNLLTVPDNGIVSGGSDSSYIHGPLKKIGNDAFTYALGDTSLQTNAYHPIGLSAPSNSTDAFIASYCKSAPLADNDSLDSLQINNCEFWKLKHDIGSSSILVTLLWNDDVCFTGVDSLKVVVANDSLTWKNLGQNSISSSSGKGSIVPDSSITIPQSKTYVFTIGNNKPPLDFDIATTGADFKNNNNGTASANVFGGVAPYEYSWNTTPSQTSYKAIGLSSGAYSVTVTDKFGYQKTGYTYIGFTYGDPVPDASAAIGDPPLESDPHRGMFVNQFFKFQNNGVDFNIASSILGVDEDLDGVFEKEVALIDYCKQNHITYINLYDLSNVFDATKHPVIWNQNEMVYQSAEEHLCRFINYARANCITQVGAVIPEDLGILDDVEAENEPLHQTIPYKFTVEEKSSSLFDSTLLIVEDTLLSTDSLFRYSEMVKLALRSSGFAGCSDCDAYFDVLMLEQEFWNVTPCDYFGTPHANLLSIRNVVDLHNQIYFQTPQVVELYLQLIGSCVPNDAIVQDIDGFDPNSIPRLADRILAVHYSEDPESAGTWWATNNHPCLFNNSGSIVSNGLTDYHPLLNAEHIENGGYVNYFGPWLVSNSSHNIFTAERHMYEHWLCAGRSPCTAPCFNNCSVAGGQCALGNFPSENNIQAGGYHWYTSKQMVGVLSDPIIFQTNGPICVGSGSQGQVTFSYQGPMELGISYTFWIEENSNPGIPVYGVIRGETKQYYDFDTDQFNPLPLDFNDPVKFPPCLLAAGEYTAHLSLTYAAGCAYESIQPITISDAGLPITVVGETVFCEGEATFLHSVNSGTVTWEFSQDGTTFSSLGVNGYELKVVKDGYYRYVISPASQCGTTSNVAHITVKPNPAIRIISDCGSSTADLRVEMNGLTSSSSEFGIGGSIYEWSNGETKAIITVAYPSSGTERYYVTVTNPYSGCSRFDRISLGNTPNTFLSGQSITNATNCSNGAINISTNTSGLNYLWSTGATTEDISAIGPGVYEVAINLRERTCSEIGTFTVTCTSCSVPVFTPTINNVSCHDDNDGSIDLNLGSGYTYFWHNIPSDGGYNPLNENQSNLYPGIYTVTITNSSGCSYNFSFEVEVDDDLNVIVNVSDVSCFGQSNGSAAATVTGGTCGSYTYNWTPGGSASSITSQSAGVYNLNVTCGSCSFTDAIVIGQPDELEVHAENVEHVSCPSGTDGFIDICAYGGTEPYTYSWNSGAYTDEDLELIAAGSYTVVVTDANGCTATTTIILETRNTSCACTTGATIIIDNTNNLASSLFTATPYTLANEDIYLKSDWIVDIPYSSNANLLFTLSECRVRANPGVKIIVRNGAGLYTIGDNGNPTVLTACSDLWGGIECRGPSSNIHMGGTSNEITIIEQADIAVQSELGGDVIISNATFDNNLTDIYLHDGDFAQNSFNGIVGCTFDYTSIANDFDEGLPKYSILLSNVTGINIGEGTFASQTNQFTKKQYGIRALNSNFNVYNSRFERCGKDVIDEEMNVARVGSGIWAASDNFTANSATISNDGGSSLPNYFIECPTGIEIRGVEEVTIEGNNDSSNPCFDDCQSAIIVDNVVSTLNISDNEFRNFLTAIRVAGMAAMTDVNITSNYFNCNSSTNAPLNFSQSIMGYKAISLRHIRPNFLQTCTIADNIISNTRIGIHLRNIDAFSGGGIVLGDESLSSGNYSNEVHYLGLTHPVSGFPHIGYWLERCDNLDVANNLVINDDDSELEIEEWNFLGFSVHNTTNTKFCENQAEKMGTSVRVFNLSQGNEFKGTTSDNCWTGFNLINADLPDQGDLTGSGISWDNRWENRMNTTNDVKGAATDFTGWTWDNNNHTANSAWDPYISALLVADFPAASTDPSCIASQFLAAATRDAYFGGIVNDTIQYVEFVEENVYNHKEYFFQSIQKHPDILNLGNSNDVIYQDEYDSLLNTNIATFEAINQYLKNDNFIEALSLKEIIEPINDIEENSNIVNNIYSSFKVDSLLTEEKEQLEEIALLSAISGGNSVYIARAILNLDVFDNPEEEGSRKAFWVDKNEAFTGRIIPNPAKNEFYYYYLLEDDKIGIFELTDITGRVVMSGKINGKNRYQKFDVSFLIPGIYCFRSFIDGKIVDNGRVVIIE